MTASAFMNFRPSRAALRRVAKQQAALDVDTTPVRGGRHIMLVRNLEPGVRLRVMAQAHAWMAGDLDLVSDDEAGRAYRHVCRPGTGAFLVEHEAIATLRAAGVIP